MMMLMMTTMMMMMMTMMMIITMKGLYLTLVFRCVFQLDWCDRQRPVTFSYDYDYHNASFSYVSFSYDCHFEDFDGGDDCHVSSQCLMDFGESKRGNGDHD